MTSALPHILVVEDDQDIQLTMQEILHEEGFAVTVADNGAQALDILARGPPPPNAILLDLMMPVMDGVEFRSRMLDFPAYATIPVVVVSADRDARRKVAQMGVAAFLPKPLNLGQLLDTLDAVKDGGVAAPAMRKA